MPRLWRHRYDDTYIYTLYNSGAWLCGWCWIAILTELGLTTHRARIKQGYNALLLYGDAIDAQ